MKRCVAFEPVGRGGPGWRRCARKAEAGLRFCERHNEAITGMMLGLHVGEVREGYWAARKPRGRK